MRRLLAGLVCVLTGFGTGAVARRWLPPVGVVSQPVVAHDPGKSAVDGATDRVRVEIPPLSARGPRPTPQQLLASHGFEFVERFAQWLPDATPAEMAQCFRSLQDPRRNSVAEDAMLVRWMELDPAGAMAFARANGRTSQAWWAWGTADPERAFAAALKDGGRFAAVSALRAAAQRDAELARRLGEEHPALFHDRIVQEGLADRLFKTDPRAAVEVCARLDSPEVNHLIATWADRDPQAAVDWILALPDMRRRAALVEEVVGRWQESHPEKIAGLVDQLPMGELRAKLLTAQVERLAATDPQAALDYAASAHGAPRTELMDAALRQVATRDPQRALAALGQVDPAEWSTGGCYGRTAAALGATAGAATMAWLDSPAGASAAAAPATRSVVFGSWLEADASAASGWLAAMPAESRPPECLQTLITHLSVSEIPDFEAARQWAATAVDPVVRNATMRQVFQRWSRSDPEAARSALDATPLPDEVRNTILQNMDLRRSRR